MFLETDTQEPEQHVEGAEAGPTPEGFDNLDAYHAYQAEMDKQAAVQLEPAQDTIADSEYYKLMAEQHSGFELEDVPNVTGETFVLTFDSKAGEIFEDSVSKTQSILETGDASRIADHQNLVNDLRFTGVHIVGPSQPIYNDTTKTISDESKKLMQEEHQFVTIYYLVGNEVHTACFQTKLKEPEKNFDDDAELELSPALELAVPDQAGAPEENTQDSVFSRWFTEQSQGANSAAETVNQEQGQTTANEETRFFWELPQEPEQANISTQQEAALFELPFLPGRIPEHSLQSPAAPLIKENKNPEKQTIQEQAQAIHTAIPVLKTIPAKPKIELPKAIAEKTTKQTEKVQPQTSEQTPTTGKFEQTRTIVKAISIKKIVSPKPSHTEVAAIVQPEASVESAKSSTGTPNPARESTGVPEKAPTRTLRKKPETSVMQEVSLAPNNPPPPSPPDTLHVRQPENPAINTTNEITKPVTSAPQETTKTKQAEQRTQETPLPTDAWAKLSFIKVKQAPKTHLHAPETVASAETVSQKERAVQLKPKHEEQPVPVIEINNTQKAKTAQTAKERLASPIKIVRKELHATAKPEAVPQAAAPVRKDRETARAKEQAPKQSTEHRAVIKLVKVGARKETHLTQPLTLPLPEAKFEQKQAKSKTKPVTRTIEHHTAAPKQTKVANRKPGYNTVGIKLAVKPEHKVAASTVSKDRAKNIFFGSEKKHLPFIPTRKAAIKQELTRPQGTQKQSAMPRFRNEFLGIRITPRITQRTLKPTTDALTKARKLMRAAA